MDISIKTKIPQFYNPIKQWISLKKQTYHSSIIQSNNGYLYKNKNTTVL